MPEAGVNYLAVVAAIIHNITPSGMSGGAMARK